jgi:hypothetical protein
MKKIFAAFSMVLAAMFLTSCGPSTDQAIAYNDAIIDEQVAIIDKIDFMYESFKNFVPDEMDKAYSDALAQLETGTANVSKMDAFDGKTDFRDAAIELFKAYKSVFDNEFKEMITIYKLPDDQYTKEQEDKWNLLSDQAIKKMDAGLQKLKDIQAEFARKYKFEVQKTL